ncbi:MAG: hypothetical protein ACI9R3_002048 [Verrucomicrobiales bacterium]|jgi:hypothetical protein
MPTQRFLKWLRVGCVAIWGVLSGADALSVPSLDWEKERAHWAYQPIKPQTVQETLDKELSNEEQRWIRARMDRFIWQGLLEQGLKPAPEAAVGTLIRRVTFDLTGLPPSFAEVQAVTMSHDPDKAYALAVERLLHSPHFGERLASMWLNVARYAEDQAHQVGNDTNYFYPNAHLFRDWVVDAFNHDMPYDAFVRFQLAADFMGEAGDENVVALGFLGLGPKYYNRKRLDVQAEEWEDRVDTVSRGFLAMTVACARCHDHKIDAITMQDYYGMAGVFASTEMWNKVLPGEVRKLDKEGKELPFKTTQTMHIVKDGDVRDLPVFERGDVTRGGEPAPRKFLQVLSASEPLALAKDGKQSGRLQLAQAITEHSKELAARVFVNRIWGMMIGKPLVATPSNFGKLGARPTHPELLDFLAADFLQNGCSVKHLVRQIVLSATYRQTADGSPEKWTQDPGNQFLGRMNRRRLSAEMLRDSALAVTGELEMRGGASTDLADLQNFRRTVYGSVSRKELDAYLAQFDYPDANVHCAARADTTTPAQKLYLLNSAFILARSEKLARQVTAAEGSIDDKVASAYARILSRQPDAQELTLARQFFHQNGKDDDARWVQFAQALLASNEFLYRD